jgi:hypothetical protein
MGTSRSTVTTGQQITKPAFYLVDPITEKATEVTKKVTPPTHGLSLPMRRDLSNLDT